MKNPLKKLSRANRTDRQEALEQDAAEKIKEVSGHAPPEISQATWVHPAPAAGPDVAPATPPSAEHLPAGRRLTVQERMAARQS